MTEKTEKEKGRTKMKRNLLAAFIGIAIMAAAGMAAADEKVKCEVLTIEASSSGQGIDPALMAHTSILQKPPFSAFNTFRLVETNTYELSLMAPIQLKLPTPLNGNLSFNRISEGKLDLTLTINRTSGTPVMVNGKATPGSPFFAAGLKSPKGRWVFGVICDRANGITTH